MGIEWASPRPSERRALRALRRVHAAIISSLPQGDANQPGAFSSVPGSTSAESSTALRAHGASGGSFGLTTAGAGGLDLGRSPSRKFSVWPDGAAAPATWATAPGQTEPLS